MAQIPSSALSINAATGGGLSQIHVDGGLRRGLPDALGRPWFAGDARGFVGTPAYDALHRVVAVTVTLPGAASSVALRIGYGDSVALEAAQALNLRGRMRERFSQAGWSRIEGVALAGRALAAVRVLSRDYRGCDDGMPAVPVPPLTGCRPVDAGLQRQGYSDALQRQDALARTLETADMQGNTVRSSWLLSGMPDSVASGSLRCLSGCRYNARGQLLALDKGSAVDGGPLFGAAFRYDPRTHACRQRYASTDPSFIAAGAGSDWIDGSSDGGRRQDIRHAFDPCGNVASVQDAYPAIVFGQLRGAKSAYGYDALYRLLTATGLESPGAGPVNGRPGARPAGGAGDALGPYCQRYAYDESGNITALLHCSRGRPDAARSAAMKVSRGSNRSIDDRYYRRLGGTAPGTAIDESFFSDAGLFDACGNQLRNANLSALVWNYQNQAIRVSYPDPRDRSRTVTEYSVHLAGGGARSRKVVETRSAQGLLARLQVITCLGMVERRQHYEQAGPGGIGYDGETVSNAIVCSDYSEQRIALGHAQQLRILSGLFAAGDAPAVRIWYSLGDQLDSCQTELDAQGGISSYQGFYPYGATAISATGEAAGEAGLALKVRRYSGEEQDGSGLYHYGFRSYNASAFRWTRPDPSGFAGSGLNWYRMVDGNPVSFRDAKGLTKDVELEDKKGRVHTVRVHSKRRFMRDFEGLGASNILMLENHEFNNQSFATLRMLEARRIVSKKALFIEEGKLLGNDGPSEYRNMGCSRYVNVDAYLKFRKTHNHQSAEFLGNMLRYKLSGSGKRIGELVYGYLSPDDVKPFSPARRWMAEEIAYGFLKNQKKGLVGVALVGAAHAFPVLPERELLGNDARDFDLLSALNRMGANTVAIANFVSVAASIPDGVNTMEARITSAGFYFRRYAFNERTYRGPFQDYHWESDVHRIYLISTVPFPVEARAPLPALIGPDEDREERQLIDSDSSEYRESSSFSSDDRFAPPPPAPPQRVSRCCCLLM